MRLADLLAELPAEQLERLGAEHLGQDENVSRSALCSTLEGVLRSYSFVRKFVADRLPPTFSILETLLDAPGYSVPAATFREAVGERTRYFSERIASGDLLGRDSSLRLYRRVLVEARKNDLELDASETAILGVLRRELSIRAVEHFLLEHHADFDQFWRTDHAFLDSMNALRSCGLVFGHDGSILLAEEVVPLVRQTLGIEMASSSRRRLIGHLSGGDISEILGKVGLKAGGSRDEKVERLVASYVQPREILKLESLQVLRDLAKEVGASSAGSKDDVVERLVEHFLHDIDIRPRTEAPPPIVQEPEPRTLDPMRFRALFAALKGDELSDILSGIDSPRVTGAKETKIALLVASPFAEMTLLEKLTNKTLEDALGRNRARTAGSKRERAERLVEFFRTLPENLIDVEPPPSYVADEPTSSTQSAEPSGEGSYPDPHD